MGSTPGKEGTFDTFFAGLLGGYLVFGRRSKRGHVSSVSKQIVIFGKLGTQDSLQRIGLIEAVFARVVLAAAQLSIQPHIGIIKNPEMTKRISHDAWPVFAALSWGSVMWLFRWHPDYVQSGLRSSMDYIYVQSDHWDSLRNFIVYNK
jgi:peroxisomal membrane protein 4